MFFTLFGYWPHGGLEGGGGGAPKGFVHNLLMQLFLYMDPLTHGGGPGSQLQVPPVTPPLYGPSPMRT